MASGISTNKVLLGMMPATLFVGIRMLLAGVLMFAYAYRTSPRLRWNYLKEDGFVLLGVALFTTYIPSILKAFGLKYLFSSKAALYGAIDPFVTALYAYILWQEKLSFRKFLGILIGFAGIMVVTFTHSASEQPWHAWLMFSWPELASIATVFVSRGGWIMIRNLVRKERYTPLEVNGLSMIISGVLALATATLLGQWQEVEISSYEFFGVLLMYTIIAGNILGYTLYAYVLKHANITLISLAGFSIPVFVGAIGWALLGEPISMALIIAALMVLVGLVVFYSDELRAMKSSPSL